MKLSSLKLNSSKKSGKLDENTLRRNKLVMRLTEQEQLINALIRGERYSPVKVKHVRDTLTGERRPVTANKRVKQWWFNTEDGKVAMSIRYGANFLELAKGKYSIEVNDLAELPAVIDVVRQAVHSGELDSQISAAATTLRKGFKR